MLDVAQGGHIKDHPAHVVGVTPHLELAPLGVQGEGVKQHGADEGDAGGLAVVDPLPGVYPQPSKFRQNINSFECLQVVDENIGNPQVLYQLKVY